MTNAIADIMEFFNSEFFDKVAYCLVIISQF